MRVDFLSLRVLFPFGASLLLDIGNERGSPKENLRSELMVPLSNLVQLLGFVFAIAEREEEYLNLKKRPQ